MNPQISLVKCKDYMPELVQSAVRKAINLLGGITNFIRPQSRVLVKPNLLMAKEPESGVDTHPEVLRAVIKILKEIKCTLFVGDGPSVWGNQIEDVDEVYRRSGIERVCKEEGVELVKFEKRRMRKDFPLARWLDHCDYLVNLPKFKTHDLTILTAAIKNLFGLVPGTFKTELHKNYYRPEDFAKMLVEIYQETKPALTLVDGVVAMEGDGPATGGRLRQAGIIVAGQDCVAIDSVLGVIMGIKPDDIFTTKEAASRGLGQARLDSISILGEKLQDVIGEPFLLPSTSGLKKKLPRPAVEIAKKLIRYYPYVENSQCIRCNACVEACPTKTISMKNNRIVFNYSLCIACFCCQEACPASAIKVKKSVFARIIGL